jgi:hypothetical protein
VLAGRIALNGISGGFQMGGGRQFPNGRPSAHSAGFRCADFAFADDAFWTDRLRYTSDSYDSDFSAGSSDEPFHVAWVACENRSFLPKGCRHHNGVNDIRRFGYA